MQCFCRCGDHWRLSGAVSRRDYQPSGFWSETDILVACIATVTVLEASRRAVGFSMTVIGLIAILYAMAGPRGELPWLGEWMPGILDHRGYSLDRIAGQLYLGQEGIFGLPLGVAATYIFIFVLFGAFWKAPARAGFYRHGLRRHRPPARRPGQSRCTCLGGHGLDFR